MLQVNRKTRWTAERIAEARLLWDRGDKSRDIAIALGTTHNAICGLAHRQGFRPRGSPPLLAAWWQRQRQQQQQRKKDSQLAVTAGISGITGITLLELSSRHCRWPVGEGRGLMQRFCGMAPAFEGTPYCAAHGALAWTTRGGVRLRSGAALR